MTKDVIVLVSVVAVGFVSVLGFTSAKLDRLSDSFSDSLAVLASQSDEGKFGGSVETVRVTLGDGFEAPTGAATSTVNNLTVSNNLTASGITTLAAASLSGTVSVDSGTLYVDATNNRVGINTTTPAYPFVFNTGATGTSTIAGSQSTSTALFIYSFTSGKGGQVILEDTDGAGCTAIAALNGTIVSYTETCPTQ